MEKCFETDRRIRLGIWGLGRGSAFVKAAHAVNIDIVAGCDYSQTLRDRFREFSPEAFITDNEDEFLSFKDMDAVLIATYFDRHTEHAIRALEAGFHVMSEVTSFFTPAGSTSTTSPISTGSRSGAPARAWNRSGGPHRENTPSPADWSGRASIRSRSGRFPS